MVIDTSAVVAILFQEPEAERLAAAIDADPVRLVSAASLLESAMVVETRFGEPGAHQLDLLLHKASVRIEPFDHEQAEFARHAFREYGKGRHRAALNFGDCFAYALSRTSGEPLLFKGDDFRHTDVAMAEGSQPQQSDQNG